MSSILRIRKLRLREVKSLAQSHTARKWHSRDLIGACLASKSSKRAEVRGQPAQCIDTCIGSLPNLAAAPQAHLPPLWEDQAPFTGDLLCATTLYTHFRSESSPLPFDPLS